MKARCHPGANEGANCTLIVIIVRDVSSDGNVWMKDVRPIFDNFFGNNKQPKQAWSQTGQVSLNDTIPKVPKIHQICPPFKILKQEDQSEGQSGANPSSVRANLILKPLLS